MERPFDKHIDNDELNALVPWSTETGQERHGLSPEAIREAERHAQSCVDCSRKVSKYRQLMGQLSNVAVSRAVPPGADCPKDIDWYDVAAGLWPELKARALIMHAALCDHCGPLLRTATALDQPPTAQEELLLAELKSPLRRSGGGGDTACGSASNDKAVTTGATLRSEVRRIRRQDSPAVWSGKPCA